MPLGSFFGDVAGGIGRGISALATGGISEMQRNQNQDLGQVLASAQTPGEAISKLGQLGTPDAVALAQKIMQSQPAFNPLTPKDAAAYGSQMYAANPLMNNPPDLAALAKGIMPGQTQAGQTDPQAASPPSSSPAAGGTQQQGKPTLADIVRSGATGTDLISALPPQIGNQVQAIIDGRQAPPSGNALKSASGQVLMQLVAQADPNFDMVNYKSRADTRKDFTSGKAAQNVTALNTAIGHMGSLLDAAGRLGNSNVPAFNWAANHLADQFGIPSKNNFELTANAVADELSRVFKGANLSDTEVREWKSKLSSSNSPEQMQGAISQGADLLSSRLDSLAEQYSKGMGTTKQGIELLNPHAQEVLAKITGGATSAKLPEAPKPLTGLTALPEGYKDAGNGMVLGPDGKKYRMQARQ